MKDILNFINGEFVATGRQFDDRSPLDNSVIGRVLKPARPRSMPRSRQRGRP